MTDKQSNHVDMILNVIRVYTDYQVMIDSKAAVGAQFVALKAKQGLIGVAIGGQSGSTATDKALVRADLDEFSFGVMAPVKGWAITQNDVRLRDEMDYSLTELGKEKDDTYVEFLRRRRDLVNGLIGLLGGLGFTTELIEEWDLKIGRYEEAVTDPRQAIINRAVHTENLDKYIKEALGICYVLDDMMVLFKGVALGDAKLLVTSDNRTATRKYKYEIFESKHPFRGVRFTHITGCDSGFILIHYSSNLNANDSLPKDMLDVNRTLSDVTVGVDFGSTNTSVKSFFRF